MCDNFSNGKKAIVFFSISSWYILDGTITTFQFRTWKLITLVTIGPVAQGHRLTIKDPCMCVPKAKHRPPNMPNADMIRAVANKTKELSLRMWTGLLTTAHVQMIMPVPDSLYSGFTH
jgi:hypothetical protein